jgi:hypothetical protein
LSARRVCVEPRRSIGKIHEKYNTLGTQHAGERQHVFVIGETRRGTCGMNT